MSCDGRFRAFCAALGGSSGPLASVFLDPQDALQTLQDVARARAPAPPAQVIGTVSPVERLASLRAQIGDAQAQADTLALFRLMRDVYQLEPPAHGDPQADGLRLPQRDACYGYQAVWQTLQATMTSQPLPDVAKEVQAAQHVAAERQREEAVRPLAQQLASQYPMLTTLCHPDAMQRVYTSFLSVDPEADRMLQQASQVLQARGDDLPVSIRDALVNYQRQLQCEAGRSPVDAIVPDSDLRPRQELALAIRRAAGTPRCNACGVMLTTNDGAHVCQVRAWVSRSTPTAQDYARCASRLGSSLTTPAALREAASNVIRKQIPEAMAQFDRVLRSAAAQATPDTPGSPADLPPTAARYALNHEADIRELAVGNHTPDRLTTLRSFVAAVRQDRADGFAVSDEIWAAATKYRASANATLTPDAIAAQQLAAQIYPPAVTSAPHHFGTAKDAAAWANTTSLLGDPTSIPWQTWDDHAGDPEELVIICAQPQDADNLAGLSTYFFKGRLGLRGECSDGDVLDTQAGQGRVVHVRFDLTKSPSDDTSHRISAELESFLATGSAVRTTNRAGPHTQGTRAVNGIQGDFWMVWR